MGIKIKKYKGTWYVFIDHQGHRKAKKIGTRQAAETVKREIEARLALGDLGFLSQDNPNTPSFAEYADSWTKHHASRHVKPSTAYFYAQYLRLYVRPAFRDTRIDQIQRQAVKDWIVDLTSRGLSRNTVRLAVSSLRVVLNGAIEDGLISSNPAHKLGRAIKVEKPEREATALTAARSGSVSQCCKGIQTLRFLSDSLANQAAEGELVALRWGDIQFGESEEDSNRYFLVQRNYDPRSGKLLTPKSKKRRRVDMSRELRQVLFELRDQRLLQTFSRGEESIEGELVFPSEVGAVLDINNLVPRHFLPLLERAGLRRIRFHDLQHSFGSLLINAGAPLTYVRDQKGHSSIKISRYVRSYDPWRRCAID